jgi:hypothetical protein
MSKRNWIGIQELFMKKKDGVNKWSFAMHR